MKFSIVSTNLRQIYYKMTKTLSTPPSGPKDLKEAHQKKYSKHLDFPKRKSRELSTRKACT